MTEDSDKQARQVNDTLSAMAAGDRSGEVELAEVLYEDLRRVAGAIFSKESPGHTLQPTALVHEAYVRLAGQGAPDDKGRTQFIALGARMMRRVLVDHARKRGAEKRGGGAERIPLEDDVVVTPEEDADVLVVDEALAKLAQLHPEQARIVELRFFGGLTMDEIAEALGMSLRTVERQWRFARAWLRKELEEDASS